MPEKEPRWLREAFPFRLSKQEKSERKDDGNRRDGQFAPPVVLPTPSKSAAGSMTDAGISQTVKTEPVPSAIGLQSNLPASSVQESNHSDVEAALRPSQPIPPHARRYENIIAADNARQISGDVYGNVYFGDNRNSHSAIGMII
jgi:hypothetical protein